MTSKELFIQTLTGETPAFERVFKALPKKKLNYRPHPRSKNAEELSAMIVASALTFPILLKKGFVDYAKDYKPVKKFDPIQGGRTFTKGIGAAAKLAKKLRETKWNVPAEMRSGKEVHWKAPLGIMMWGLLLDLIHHRGQLSTYLRPMGGKVPSIYGPSGDSNG